MSQPEDHAQGAAEGSLWGFAVALYSAPGVADACLGLQDRYGCDVNVLLFAAWVGAVRHGAMTLAEMAEAVAVVQSWHQEIVRPLRDLRRRLKSGPPPAPSESTEGLRTRIKAIELEAERIELAMLEQLAARWAPPLGARGEATLENLMAAVRHFIGQEPSDGAVEFIRSIEQGIATKRINEIKGEGHERAD
jgi:uncharacterized protein (TIGR02444 family)